MLDSSDEDTIEVSSLVADETTRIVHTDVADLGGARNAGVSNTNASFVAFLDSDDLWGCDWLYLAHASAVAHGTDAVWHPQVSFFFGDDSTDSTVYHHLASTDAQFDLSRFRMHNSWTALSFAPIDLYRRWPYPRNHLSDGFGFEDWSWNEATLGDGIDHLVVPDTCHFVSKANSRDSLLAESSHAMRTPYGQMR